MWRTNLFRRDIPLLEKPYFARDVASHIPYIHPDPIATLRILRTYLSLVMDGSPCCTVGPRVHTKQITHLPQSRYLFILLLLFLTSCLKFKRSASSPVSSLIACKNKIKFVKVLYYRAHEYSLIVLEGYLILLQFLCKL